jgi:predicted metal-binding protein
MGMVESTFYGTYKINYVDRDGEPVISVLVDDNMVNVYKNIRGDVLVICKICGKSFKQNSNRHSFCIECSKQRRNEKVKENMAKMRKKLEIKDVII